MKTNVLSRPQFFDLERRGCQSKAVYRDEREGLRALKSIRKDGKIRNFSTLNVYHCQFCSLWHIGHDGTRRRP